MKDHRWEITVLQVAIWLGIVILVGAALCFLILWWEWSAFEKAGKPLF